MISSIDHHYQICQDFLTIKASNNKLFELQTVVDTVSEVKGLLLQSTPHFLALLSDLDIAITWRKSSCHNLLMQVTETILVLDYV